MNTFTHGVEAEVNGTYGLALGVESLEERIAPCLCGLEIDLEAELEAEVEVEFSS
jgi:hypothetical protein